MARHERGVWGGVLVNGAGEDEAGEDELVKKSTPAQIEKYKYRL